MMGGFETSSAMTLALTTGVDTQAGRGARFNVLDWFRLALQTAL